MSTRADVVLHVEVNEALGEAFEAAAERKQVTGAEMLRRLIRSFVENSLREEAERQSILVANAPDAKETMDIMMEVQGFVRD